MRTENLLRVDRLFNDADATSDSLGRTLRHQWIGSEAELATSIRDGLKLSELSRVPDWMVSADFRIHRAGKFYSPEIAAGPERRRRVLELALGEGLTICLYSVQKFSPDIHRVSAALAARIGAVVSVSMVVCRGPAAGLPAHFDRDSIVVQHISGRKCWTVWPGARASDSEDSGMLSDDELSRLTGFECELTAGDLMFLPAGAAHSTATPAGSTSIHLSYDCRPAHIEAISN